MRHSLVLVLVASVAASSAVASTAPSEFGVTRWSARWTHFSDDFEDGVYPDGDPGEVSLYADTCGVVDDADEAGGRLRLQGPQAPCGGVAVSPHVLLATAHTLRARFHVVTAPTALAFGMTVSNPGTNDRIDLVLQRGTLLGPGSDAIGVTLFGDAIPAERTLLSANAASFLAQVESFELEVEVTPSVEGTRGVPHGRIRTCPLAGCEPSAGFTDLPDDPGSLPGAGTLASGQRLEINFLVQSAQSFTVDLLDWSLDTNFVDEFDGVFGDRLLYETRCVDAQSAGGTLRATLTDGPSCDGHGIAGLVSVAGEASAQATFEWRVPALCSDAYGVALFADRDAVDAADGAHVFLTRGPIPGLGNDVLYVVLETETALPLRPWLEFLVLSTTPDQALASIDSIELRVETQYDVETGALFPHGQARICAGPDCQASGVPFQDLAPFVFPQGNPNLLVCGRRAADLAPPLDGGAIDPIAPLIPVMVFVPEPTSAAAAMMALAALGLVRVQRQRKSGQRSQRARRS